MAFVLQVAGIVAPVFVLAAIGYGWVARGLDFPVTFVTRLATYIALPCLIFSTLVTTELEPGALGEVVVASVLGYGAMTGITWAVVWAAGLDQRTYLAPLIFGNTGNLGLPLALFAFGDVGLSYAVVVFAVMAVGTFTYGVWMVAGRSTGWTMLLDPMVVAAFLGALFLWQGWGVPQWVGNSLALLGQLAIPLMLLTLGVAVSRLKPAQFGRSAIMSILKLVLSVGIAAATGVILDLPTIAFAVLVLQLSTPVAVTSYLLAERYGADAEAVAGLVVVSTILSVGALPLIIGWFIPS